VSEIVCGRGHGVGLDDRLYRLSHLEAKRSQFESHLRG
jgi:hypothetical protein